MQLDEQRKVFLKIVLASIRNMAGFGVASVAIGYVAAHFGVSLPLKILAVVVVFVMAVSLNTLLMFTIFTLKNIPATMASSPVGVRFLHLYGYTLTALVVRLVEAGVCVAYLVYLYRIFY
jgi:hypothetical protein